MSHVRWQRGAEAPWKAAAPDTHEIEVSVSPYVFDNEASYANNLALKTVTLGIPVGVDQEHRLRSRLWFARPRPNPSNGLVSFAFEVPARGTVTLEVFDVLGRRVRRWIWRDLTAGGQTFEWNGRSETGALVPPGLLLCRLSGAGATQTRKLVFRP